jgi:hypothetical protein
MSNIEKIGQSMQLIMCKTTAVDVIEGGHTVYDDIDPQHLYLT